MAGAEMVGGQTPGVAYRTPPRRILRKVLLFRSVLFEEHRELVWITQGSCFRQNAHEGFRSAKGAHTENGVLDLQKSVSQRPHPADESSDLDCRPRATRKNGASSGKLGVKYNGIPLRRKLTIRVSGPRESAAVFEDRNEIARPRRRP